MWGSNTNGYFSDFVKSILKNYRSYVELDLSAPIGFSGAASQRLTIYTPQIDSDALLFGAAVDFNNALVLIRVMDVSSGYQWSPQNDTPIGAIAGLGGQVMPVLDLTCPFFLSRNSKLQMDWTNSAAASTTGGNITWRGIKLLN